MSKNNNDFFKFKYETITGSFVDYRGATRDYTMVAVSIPLKPADRISVAQFGESTIECEVPEKNILNETTGAITYVPAHIVEENVETVENICDVAKILSVGVSVRCNRDKAQDGLSEKIAYGKAVNVCNHAMYVTHSGMVNTKMVRAFLEQEAAHFEKDPGSYIESYNADKEAFWNKGKIAPVEMTDDEYAKHVDGLKLADSKNNEPPICKCACSTKEKLLSEIMEKK